MPFVWSNLLYAIGAHFFVEMVNMILLDKVYLDYGIESKSIFKV